MQILDVDVEVGVAGHAAEFAYPHRDAGGEVCSELVQDPSLERLLRHAVSGRARVVHLLRVEVRRIDDLLAHVVGDLQHVSQPQDASPAALEEVQASGTDGVDASHHLAIEGHEDVVVEVRIQQLAARPGLVDMVEAHDPLERTDGLGHSDPCVDHGGAQCRIPPEVVEARGDLLRAVVCVPGARGLVTLRELRRARPLGSAMVHEGLSPQVLVHIDDDVHPRIGEHLCARCEGLEIVRVRLAWTIGRDSAPEGEQAHRIHASLTQDVDVLLREREEIVRCVLGHPRHVDASQEEDVVIGRQDVASFRPVERRGGVDELGVRAHVRRPGVRAHVRGLCVEWLGAITRGRTCRQPDEDGARAVQAHRGPPRRRRSLRCVFGMHGVQRRPLIVAGRVSSGCRKSCAKIAMLVKNQRGRLQAD